VAYIVHSNLEYRLACDRPLARPLDHGSHPKIKAACNSNEPPELTPAINWPKFDSRSVCSELCPRHPLRRFLRVMVVRSGNWTGGIRPDFSPRLSCLLTWSNGVMRTLLRPILMHRVLVHIRTCSIRFGDSLQLFNTSLWWFNPLIHYAGRRVDRGTERCRRRNRSPAIATQTIALCPKSVVSFCKPGVQWLTNVTFSGTRAMEFNAERMKANCVPQKPKPTHGHRDGFWY
jgi:hypothetical protein